ncbi:hypothetical protein L3X38_012508 [Prunus dulcis]|uniref:Uncharacterized protein n=1 Tax=Prunus dulcis TaxID=3755 RepID=A0AAD4ZGG0_PRUDU|nr:hypothetical protein L3X38_012508 [Prunus dulcis]
MRGEVEVLQELIQANPESVYLRVDNRLKETVLHLRVKYNHLECLNSKAGSDAGMTILQLALMLAQIQGLAMDKCANLRVCNEWLRLKL